MRPTKSPPPSLAVRSYLVGVRGLNSFSFLLSGREKKTKLSDNHPRVRAGFAPPPPHAFYGYKRSDANRAFVISRCIPFPVARLYPSPELRVGAKPRGCFDCCATKTACFLTPRKKCCIVMAPINPYSKRWKESYPSSLFVLDYQWKRTWNRWLLGTIVM